MSEVWVKLLAVSLPLKKGDKLSVLTVKPYPDLADKAELAQLPDILCGEEHPSVAAARLFRLVTDIDPAGWVDFSLLACQGKASNLTLLYGVTIPADSNPLDYYQIVPVADAITQLSEEDRELVVNNLHKVNIK